MKVLRKVSLFFKVRFSQIHPIEHGFLQTPASPSNIAAFLVQNPFVDKKLLGLYLAKPDNQETLYEFVNRLGFKGVLLLFLIYPETN